MQPILVLVLGLALAGRENSSASPFVPTVAGPSWTMRSCGRGWAMSYFEKALVSRVMRLFRSILTNELK
jgi:hypothetical protein